MAFRYLLGGWSQKNIFGKHPNNKWANDKNSEGIIFKMITKNSAIRFFFNKLKSFSKNPYLSQKFINHL